MNVLALHAPVMAASGGGDASTITGILGMATEVVKWLVTSMGEILKFVTTNPIILLMAIIMLAGLVVGMLFRIWHSV